VIVVTLTLMHDPAPPVPIWVRAVADPAFREALIEDPLRALASEPGVAVSPEQVRQLEQMDPAERAEFVRGVVREVHMRGGQARFGAIGPDGRIGGVPPPEPPAAD
jgi:hypothetical protein